MLRPEKRSAVEDANRLEQAVAVKESAVKNGHNRFFFGNELAVKENEHASFYRKSCGRRRKKFVLGGKVNRFAA